MAPDVSDSGKRYSAKQVKFLYYFFQKVMPRGERRQMCKISVNSKQFNHRVCFLHSLWFFIYLCNFIGGISLISSPKFFSPLRIPNSEFRILYNFPFAGPSSTLPPSSNLDPWQEQSQLRSSLFHLSAHPRCGHLGFVGVRRFTVVSRALTKS